MDTSYQMRRAQERLPEIDLFPQVDYAGRKIDAAAFGPNIYDNNIKHMKQRYWHSDALPDVTFVPLSTAESIAVIANNFINIAKPMILDTDYSQLERILRTQDGVWDNLPRNEQGNLITDENTLKKCLNQAKN